MPVTPTYPGVYIEEIPSGVRTITGVATSIAAFVDFFARGSLNRAVQIFNMGDFEREFGGLHTLSEASYAIQQFFLNGGGEAHVVRVGSDNLAAASVQIGSAIGAGGGTAPLTVTAINPGAWGNNLRVRIDHLPPTSGTTSTALNLVVSQYETLGGRTALVRQEIFRNLVFDPTKSNHADTVVNDPNTGSKLVRITTTGTTLPLANGTLGSALAGGVALPATPVVNVTISDGTTTTTQPATLRLPDGTTGNQTARAIAPLLESAIRSADPANGAFAGATVEAVGDRLRILAGPGNVANRVQFADEPENTTAAALKLVTGTANITATLSGEHATAPTLPASADIAVTINGTSHNVTLAFTAGAVPLDAVAPVLEAAIRDADAANPAFAEAIVRVVGQRLMIIPGGTAAATASFADVNPETAATTLKLLAADTTNRAVTLGGAHTADPVLPDTLNVTATAGGTSHAAPLKFTTAPTLPSAVPLTRIAPALQAALSSAVTGNAAFNDTRVFIAGQRLVIVSGDATPMTFANTPGSTAATTLGLVAGAATANLREYTLGNAAAIANSAQGGGTTGNDGSPPDGTALIGSQANKSGLFALEDVDLFNILCLPRTAIVTGDNALTATQAQAVLSVATTYCEQRRAFLLVDTPTGRDELQEIKQWMADNDGLRHRNAALYYPRVMLPDPLNDFRLRSFGASGTIAGLYARTDNTRGVWKAPAGTEATLRNVSALEDVLTDNENGALNPLAINCLRTFPVFGTVAWGARTLDGSDQEASEWKYVPVRRLALFLEESLYRGTKWVVFEPNDEPLWAQIRLNIGAFMQNLFRQGAFQGRTPREAYFVKCDRETTTQTDINLGIVNIVVGFAPLKPAEFVIIKFQQMAGQIEV